MHGEISDGRRCEESAGVGGARVTKQGGEENTHTHWAQTHRCGEGVCVSHCVCVCGGRAGVSERGGGGRGSGGSGGHMISEKQKPKLEELEGGGRGGMGEEEQRGGGDGFSSLVLLWQMAAGR